MNGEKLFYRHWGFRIALRSGLALVLGIQLLLGGWAGVAGAATTASEDSSELAVGSTREQVGDAVASLQEIVRRIEPVSDWAAFGLARSGLSVGGRYLPQAIKSVEDGGLRLATDFARVALAVNASGGDAGKVGAKGSDLLSKMANVEKLTAQGPNAPAYALLAMDAASYEPGADDRWTRDDLIKWLVDNQGVDGGWSLTPGKSEVDITVIVLAALAPYQTREDIAGVKNIEAVIDKALVWLSGVQHDNGGFGNPVESSESAAQVLIALTSLGIDPMNDPRFIKNGKSALDRLLEYKLGDGQFTHVMTGKADGIATLNALLGLTAVERWMDGLPGLYSGVAAAAKAQVTVSGLTSTIAAGSETGKTALEALVNLLKNVNMPYEIERHPQFGAFLKSISGLESSKFGGYDGWKFAVKRNGEWVAITEGMGTFALQSGDGLFVYYGGDDTTLIHSVELEPAAPREGREVTVTVEKEALDWETGKLVVSAAEGARVQVAGQSVVTDKEGKAQLQGLKAGVYAVFIGGYRPDAAPLYLESHIKLEVASYLKDVTVRVEGDAGLLATGKAEGGTALEAVEQVLKDSAVKYEIKDMAYGKYIDSVGGTSGGKYGGYDGWLFAVMRGGSWVIPAEGIGTFLLEDGDEVVVYYGNDTTRLVDQVVTSPAAPAPGSDFTASVTNRAWNWEKNQFDAAEPLPGVKVSVGGTESMTDAAGQVKLKGLLEGLYKLEVTGYAQDGVPSVVHSVAELPIVGSYKDQDEVSAWALDWVRTSRGAGLLRGLSDGLDWFKPQQAVTRAEFVSGLARGMGLKTGLGSTFTDIPSDAWYAKDVEAAATAGLVRGIGGEKFAPDAPLTREQAAVLLRRALQLTATTTTELADAKQISTSMISAVQAVLEEGWMTAYRGNFAPKAALTREQAAIIVVRVMRSER